MFEFMFAFVSLVIGLVIIKNQIYILKLIYRLYHIISYDVGYLAPATRDSFCVMYGCFIFLFFYITAVAVGFQTSTAWCYYNNYYQTNF